VWRRAPRHSSSRASRPIIHEIGDKLHVAFVVEGECTQAGRAVESDWLIVVSAPTMATMSGRAPSNGNCRTCSRCNRSSRGSLVTTLQVKLTGTQNRAAEENSYGQPTGLRPVPAGKARGELLSRPDSVERAERFFPQSIAADPAYAPSLRGLGPWFTVFADYPGQAARQRTGFTGVAAAIQKDACPG